MSGGRIVLDDSGELTGRESLAEWRGVAGRGKAGDDPEV